MDEDKTKEEPKETTETEDTGVQPSATTELDRADQIAERLKRENDRKDELLTREEALAARRAVGGVTEAGQVMEKKVETDEEYTERFMKGEVNPMKENAEQN